MTKHARGAPLPPLDLSATPAASRRAQVYKACLKAILDGRLWPGSRLPSSRELAREWGLARNTVDEALLQLQADGFLDRRVGDGTYVAQRLPGRFAAAAPRALRPASEAGRVAMASFSAWARSASASHFPGASPRPRAFMGGFPALDHFPIQLWQRLMTRRMRRDGRRLLGYFPAMGYGPLREATARHLAAARGVSCAPEQVMILSSSMQGLDLIARVLLERDDPAWIEAAGYPNVRVALSMSGARPMPVPVDEEGMDVAAGRALCPRAPLVHVTPACHYASGARLSLKRRLDLLQWAEQAGAWIVEDDYQGDFSYEDRGVESLHALDRGARVLHLGSFTNSVFPSLRLAYLVIPPEMVEVFEAVRSQLDDHTHGIQQAVLADFIDEGHLAAHLRRMKPVYRERRDALVEACRRWLPMARLGPTQGGFSMALHLPRIPRDRTLRERAGAELELMPLSRFDAAMNGFLLGYAALAESEIRAGVRKLAELAAR